MVVIFISNTVCILDNVYNVFGSIVKNKFSLYDYFDNYKIIFSHYFKKLNDFRVIKLNALILLYYVLTHFLPYSE